MNTDFNNLQCVECGQSEDPMIVFAGNYMFEDGTIEDLPDGMHPYCEPCRRKLQITDELNPGRDLREEARQAVHDALKEAIKAGTSPTGRDRGSKVIMREVDRWVGGTDGLMSLLGRDAPARPPEVYEGVNDALGEIDPSMLTISHSLALITVTNQLEDRLSNWRVFVDRTFEHYKHIEGEDRARKLLVGFIK